MKLQDAFQRPHARVENPERVERLMRSAVSRLDLDLNGIAVLTEGASGNFIVTPLMAALAGSPHVVALSADSRYGKASDVARIYHGMRGSAGGSGSHRGDDGSAPCERCRLQSDHQSRFCTAHQHQSRRAVARGYGCRADVGSRGSFGRRMSISKLAEIEVSRSLEPAEIDVRVGTFRYVGLIVLKLLLESALEVDGSDILVVVCSSPVSSAHYRRPSSQRRKRDGHCHGRQRGGGGRFSPSYRRI